MRKGFFITMGIYLSTFLIGLLGVLSCKYGNIAKYAYDSQLSKDIQQCANYFGILGGIWFIISEEQVPAFIRKDYNIGWHNYLSASGVKAKTAVGERFILLICLYALSIILGVFGFNMLNMVSGESLSMGIVLDVLGNHLAPVLLIIASSVFMVMSGFCMVFEYMYKGKSSLKADLIKLGVVIVLMVIPMVIAIINWDKEDVVKKAVETVKGFKQHIEMLYIVPIAFALVMTAIFYMISIRLVKREGKHV